MNLIEHVKAYREQGWSFFPLEPKEKRPLVWRDGNGVAFLKPDGEPKRISWEEYQRRAPRTDERNRWFNGKLPNLGIVGGAVSGNLVMIDVDRPEECQDWLKKYFTDIPGVKTGKGWHFYVTTPTPTPCFVFEWGEIKGEGGYCVAPPSVHPETGKTYKWRGGIGAVAIESLEELEIYPKKLKLDGPVVEGNRNMSLTSRAGWLRKGGWAEDEILNALLFLNDKLPEPLGAVEVAIIARSVSRYEPAEKSLYDPL